MPYGVFKTGADEKPYCVYKVDADGGRTGESLGCHASDEAAKKQIQAIGAASHASVDIGSFLKTVATAGSVLEGKVHEAFTVIADRLYQNGILTREERIALSSAIGKSLAKLSQVIDDLGLCGREIPPEILIQASQVRFVADPFRAGDESEMLIAYGGELKAMGDGRVGGYLVVFSPDGKQKDLQQQYFTRRTRLHWAGAETRPAMYHHGLDSTMGKKELGTGWHFGRITDVGLWVETQLKMRDEYERAIYKLAERRKLGLSSGTASHMIDVAEDGEILLWPIVEGSFTPSPAEYRARVMPLRAVEPCSLKSLTHSPRIGGGVEAPGKRGPGLTRRGLLYPTGLARILDAFRAREEAKSTMSVEELLNAIKQLVPDIPDDQLEQIRAILQMGMGEPVGEVAPEEGMTEEIRAYFGAGSLIDPWKGLANIDEVLSVIQQVVSLSEEQLAKLGSVLQLALANAAAEEEVMDEEEFDLEEEEEFDLEGEEELMPPEEEEIRAIVAEAVDEVMGEEDFGLRPRRRRYATRAVSRPPYSFNRGRQERDNPGNPYASLRYSETGPSAAVKAIARDLYGTDYELKRYKQAVAFGRLLRFGTKALDSDGLRSLREVVLTPGQIKAYALSGMEVAQMKTDMSDVIDQLGGLMVPEDFRSDMIERLPGLTVVRRYADVLQTGSDMMTRVKITGGNTRYTSAVRVTWVGDVPAAGDADTRPRFGVERTPIHIAKAVVHVPMSLLEDTPFPLVQKINEWVSEAYAIDEDEQCLVGNGIAKPEGILPDSANPGTRLAEAITEHATLLTFDGLKTLKYSIARQYRQGGAIWVMNDGSAQAVSKMKDGEGRYLWEDSQQEGEPDRLLGFPVETSEAMPDIEAGAYPILFGNLKQGYQMADRIGMSVVRDDVTQAEEDLVKFIFRRRIGAGIKLEAAMAVQVVSEE